MRDGPEAGLAMIDALLARGELAQVPPRPRGACRPAAPPWQDSEARQRYRTALELTRQEPERRFIERRLREAFTPG